MFFFQDNIGVLILMQKLPFWSWVFTPVAEHFEPVTNTLLYLEYKLFHLEFYGFLTVSIFLHLLNVFLLYKLAREITKSKFFSLISSLLFAINLTYTEPILWSLHGLLISTFFIGNAFLFWWKYMEKKERKFYYFSIVFLITASLSYGLGVGTGIVFAVATFIYKFKEKTEEKILVPLIYSFLGVISYAIGPLLASNFWTHITPKLSGSTANLWLYPAFVVAGVSRGVIGRLFLPGFEPRHFEVIPSIISFVPALLVILLIFRYMKNKSNKTNKLLMIILILFIFYPYIWAGFVRFHFGLKQALAERYAYPSLFFFSVLMSLLIKELLGKKFIRSVKYLIIYVAILITFQSIIFIRNAVSFEEKPRITKNYFGKLEYILKTQNTVLDLPLPTFVNQPYIISDLAPVILNDKNIKFVRPDFSSCPSEIRTSLNDKKILEFYSEQSRDETVQKVFDIERLNRCLTKGGTKL